MSIVVRLAKDADRSAAVAAERKAVRGLFYLDDVWDQFLADQSGELLVGEVEGQVVAVGKYTLLPDGSAWLETLRVDPEFQGRGIGKAFYTRFLEHAALQEVRTLGMYTGWSNVVSKGLAERFGFAVTASYRGAIWTVPQEANLVSDGEFQRLRPTEAVEQLLPLAAAWDEHLVMNRTFYPATAGTFAAMAREGKVYRDELSGSLAVFGYRFLRERGLHLALVSGDVPRVLSFAKSEVQRLGLPQLTIMFPPAREELQATLLEEGFVLEPSDCIVLNKFEA